LLRAELTRNEPGSPKLHSRHPADRVSRQQRHREKLR
jgi:hypothetical protein